MKALLNTLFIATQGAYLSREGLTVAVSVDRQTLARVPIHTLSGIVCFGQVSCSPFIMQLAAEHGVSLAFCTEHGRFIARMQGPISGNVLLRRQQYRASEDRALSAGIARNVVAAKVANSRTVLVRAAREGASPDAKHRLESAALRLRRISDQVGTSDDLDMLRGFEGDAANIYFSVFNHLILGEKDHFFYERRSRRPPTDNLNALLSFLYTLLANDTASALECVGLDPQVGFLHRERPGRPSLALDLMEEFRAMFSDRLVLTMVNLRQVKATGFRTTESGGVIMDDPTRKEVLTQWQARKAEEIMHPYLGERVPLGLLPFVQSLLLARFLRGDLDGYPAFFWR